MSLAHVKYPLQCAAIKAGAAGSDITSAVTGKTVDRRVNGRPNSLGVVVAGELTTASGATGDEVDITVTLLSGETTTPTNELREKTISVVVDDDDEAKTFSVLVELPINDAEQYVAAKVIAAAGTGAPTLTDATATIAYILGGLTSGALQQNDTVEGAYDAVATA